MDLTIALCKVYNRFSPEKKMAVDHFENSDIKHRNRGRVGKLDFTASPW